MVNKLNSNHKTNKKQTKQTIFNKNHPMSFKSSVLLASLIYLRKNVSLKYQYCIDISGYLLFFWWDHKFYIFIGFIFSRDGCDNGPQHFGIWGNLPPLHPI